MPYIGILSLWVLILRPRLILRWATIGVAAAILALPVIPKFIENGPGRIGQGVEQPLPPLREAIESIYRDFGGPSWFLWLIITLLILVTVRAIGQPFAGRWLILFSLWMSFPIIVYFFVGNLEYMKPRYMRWVATGIALLMGNVIVGFPALVQWGAVIAGLCLPLIPVDFDNYRLYMTASPPFRSVFSWYAKQIRPGDVLIIDPDCTCGVPEGWDYFVPLYFPSRHLPIVDEPGDASRVWYLSTGGKRDEQFLAEIEQGRTPSIFVGPWFFLLRLYEGPPSWEGVSFGNKINFHGFEILDMETVLSQGEKFQVKL